MFQSFRASQWALRIGLTVVYGWFGVAAFLNQTSILVLFGLFYVVAAISFATGFFSRIFALLAIGVLLSVIVFDGMSGFIIQDVGLIGALLAIAVWPERRY